MKVYYFEINKHTYVNRIIQILIFVINPFLSFCTSLYRLKGTRTHSEYKWIYFLIALFLGVLAFTQKTNSGDIIRTYEYTIQDSSNWMLIALDFRSSLFKIINVFIYSITGNVQYLSLFWVTAIYYLLFLSILNIFDYKKFTLNRLQAYFIYVVIFCFVIFTQVTEIMKQAVAASLFIYSFSNFINGRKLKGILPYILSLGIHGSSFFYLPLFMVFFIRNKKIFFYCALFSFLFRQFNLMEFVSSVLGGINIFSSITLLADSYNEKHLENFFSSDSLFFQIVFWIYFFVVIYIYMKNRNKGLFINVCLLMVVILNLNYSISHNFTRMLTMLYPFYIMIYSEFYDNCNNTSLWVRKMFVVFTGLLSFYMILGRLFGLSGYNTSFMDNSLLKIIISPLYSYLTTIAF